MNLTSQRIVELVASISFRDVQPLDGAAFIGVRGDGQRGANVVNTRFAGADTAELPHGLDYLLRVEGMSTIAIAYVINRLVDALAPGECYLNVGCWKGYSFLAGVLQGERSTHGAPLRERSCIGVDNFSEFAGRDEFWKAFAPIRRAKAEFHEMDFETFFKSELRQTVGLYFYDGSHTAEHQRIGLELVVPFLSPNAVILVDDTNWPDARNATLEFLSANAHEFELVVDQPTAGNGHPTFWNGLMILQRKGSGR